MSKERIEELFQRFPLKDRWVMLGRVGSDSHGTKVAPSAGGIDDEDFMGIVLPDAKNLVGFGTWEGWNHGPDEEGLDVVLYSLKKFVSLLLKSNPNVLGMLWMRDEDYIYRDPSFERLMALREAFSSKAAYPSFVGYAHSQLKKMVAFEFKGFMGAKRKALVEKFGYDCKNAAHLIRLLRMGVEYFQTGKLRVYRGGLDASELIAIKRGEWDLHNIRTLAGELFAEAEKAIRTSPLPDEPDYAVAERYLIDEHLRILDASR